LNRLFRQPIPGRSGYSALMIFVVIYLVTVSLVVTPRAILAPWNTTESQSDGLPPAAD
jgi:hypothetical protein